MRQLNLAWVTCLFSLKTGGLGLGGGGSVAPLPYFYLRRKSLVLIFKTGKGYIS